MPIITKKKKKTIVLFNINKNENLCTNHNFQAWEQYTLHKNTRLYVK